MNISKEVVEQVIVALELTNRTLPYGLRHSADDNARNAANAAIVTLRAALASENAATIHQEKPVGYVPYCHTDGMDCMKGEFRMAEFDEKSFMVATPEHWECRAVYLRASEGTAPPINQCDGCLQGAALKGDLHVDGAGKAFMACEREKYAAPPVRSEPEGWKLVPVNPTGAMINAGGFNANLNHRLSSELIARYAYSAMLATAPECKS